MSEVRSSTGDQSLEEELSELYSNIEAPEVSLLEHFEMDMGDGLYGLCSLGYGSTSHYLTSLRFIYAGEKAAGYTMEDFQSVDVDSIFPDFAEISFAETDEYVLIDAMMSDLEDPDRIAELVAYDFIVLDNGADQAEAVDADTLIQSFYENGYEEISVERLSLLQHE